MIRVSVITVCYNAEKVIEKAIQSVLMQTYGNIEYIIQDGGSTDKTPQIIQTYIKKYPEIKIIYESKKDGGIYNAMNLALEKITGEWCVFINADDSFFSDTVLEEVFGVGQQYDNYAAVFGGYRRHDSKNGYIFQSESIEIIPRKMPFVHQSIFVRTSVLKEYKYNESYKLCADYDMFLRMYIDGLKFFQVKTIIADYSIEGISGDRTIEALKETIQIKENYENIYPITVKQRIKWKNMILSMKIKQKIPVEVMIQLRKIKAYIRTKILGKTTN